MQHYEEYTRKGELYQARDCKTNFADATKCPLSEWGYESYIIRWNPGVLPLRWPLRVRLILMACLHSTKGKGSGQPHVCHVMNAFWLAADEGAHTCYSWLRLIDTNMLDPQPQAAGLYGIKCTLSIDSKSLRSWNERGLSATDKRQ